MSAASILSLVIGDTLPGFVHVAEYGTLKPQSEKEIGALVALGDRLATREEIRNDEANVCRVVARIVWCAE